MADISTYAADKLLDALLNDTSYTSTTTYVALFTVAPTMPAGTGGTEVSTGSYAREELDASLASASSGSIASNADITFTTATASWGTIVGAGIFDASTSGNLLVYHNLTASKAVGSGDTFSIPSGDLTVSIS